MNAMAFSTMVVLMTGGCLVQLDRFHPQTWWQSVAQSRATVVHYLGVMPAMLLSAPPQSSDPAHAVRFGFGAGVDQRNHAPFEARFGFPLVEAWAMTETGAAACIMANHEPRQVGTHCFGKPASFVQVRLVDDAGGRGFMVVGVVLFENAVVDTGGEPVLKPLLGQSKRHAPGRHHEYGREAVQQHVNRERLERMRHGVAGQVGHICAVVCRDHARGGSESYQGQVRLAEVQVRAHRGVFLVLSR
jgi:hypothetical protein